MRGFTKLDIHDFLNQYDYDIRKSGDARWIDQKCTMDVVSLIADCILQFVGEDKSQEFTVNDIWHNEYTVENVQQIFSKPNPDEEAPNEYDKYFGQPMKLLAYSKILNCKRRGNTNYYTINDYELLEFISIRERNAFMFLCSYIEKVLKDSDLFSCFDEFYQNPNRDTYRNVKETFSNFTIKYTRINGKVECNRIFIKVLNPLACQYKTQGTVRGRLSKDIITLDMIAYNQRNWRDLYSQKPKGVTREDYAKTLPEKDEDEMTIYKINKAKNFLRKYNNKYNNGKTELVEENQSNDLATQMHHIFPVSYYPEIGDYLENLIALTPTQHLNYAHPNNNTQYIDKVYQYYCLIAKTAKIKENLMSEELPTIYSFDDYIYVLNIGLDTDEFDKIKKMDFDSILRLIEEFYEIV